MLQTRQGPPPIIQAADVEAASDNKLRLLRALAQDASIRGNLPSDWYLITEAGFNFIDDQCRAYFDELFFLDRRKNAIKNGLFAGNQTTQAILAVTGATTPTMNIVAQAFGFSITATDLVAGTYLYQLPPATTQGFVSKLQLAYREGAARSRGAINSPTSAYYFIQGYLDLCLPPRIEAEITKQISATTAGAVPRDGGLFSVETASVAPALEPDADGPMPPGPGPDTEKKKRGPKSQTQVTPTPTAPTVIAGGVTNIEKAIPLETGKAIQRMLCVAPSGNFADTPTRIALRQFNSAEPTNNSNGAIRTDADMDRVLAAVGAFPSCEKVGLRNGFEAGIFSRLGADTVRRNLAAGLKVQGLPAPDQLTSSASTPADAVVRKAVRDLRAKFGMSDVEDMDKAFYDKLRSVIER